MIQIQHISGKKWGATRERFGPIVVSYIAYINDFLDINTNPNISSLAFADDIKTYVAVKKG